MRIAVVVGVLRGHVNKGLGDEVEVGAVETSTEGDTIGNSRARHHLPDETAKTGKEIARR